jgi:glycosyltransferase involved in cell wall biosynthesis
MMRKVSIITVSYNSELTIQDTIESVLAQDYPNFEYIIIDGASNDSTMEIIRGYGGRIDTVISELDNGIYDGMNKGIRVASGDVVGFINSDDFYPSSSILTNVMQVFSDPLIDVSYGDLCYVKPHETSSVVRYWKSSEFVPGSFRDGWCPPHPTFFVRRKIYEELGGFDLNYKIAADVELMMRFLEVHKVKSSYLPEVLVHMRLGGETNKSMGNIIRQNKEIWRALEAHGLKPSFLRFVTGKVFSRGKQFMVRPSR